MQLYVHRKLRLDEVHPQNIFGYGFAAPKPVTGRFTELPAAYPIYLFENSDDAVPRSGALVHLGVRLVYQADEKLRAQCYAWPRDEISARNRLLVRPIIERMADMPRILEVFSGYLTVLTQLPVEETAESLALLPFFRAPLVKLAAAADTGLDTMVHFVARRCSAAYVSLTGHEMDAERVAADTQAITRIANLIGVRAFTVALSQLGIAPHSITVKVGTTQAVYAYIVTQELAQLRAAAWTGGEAPQLRHGGRVAPVTGELTVARRRPSAPVRAARRPRGGISPLRSAPKLRENRAGTTEEV